MKDEEFWEIFNTWENLIKSPEKYEAYRARRKYILDEEAKWDDVRYKAEQKGRKEGRRLASLYVAKNMLAKDISIDEIVEITDLSEEEVNRIQKETS